jgi:hypothetical protein
MKGEVCIRLCPNPDLGLKAVSGTSLAGSMHSAVPAVKSIWVIVQL